MEILQAVPFDGELAFGLPVRTAAVGMVALEGCASWARRWGGVQEGVLSMAPGRLLLLYELNSSKSYLIQALFEGVYQTKSSASLRRSITDLSWLHNELAHEGPQRAMLAASQPQSGHWLDLNLSYEHDVDWGLRFTGEQSPLAGHPVARRRLSLLTLAESGLLETRVPSASSPEESSPIRALNAWLFVNLGGSLLRLVIGIRSVLCLILVMAALARWSDATYLTLVLITVSRCFGCRGEPDDPIPALRSMPVVIGEAVRTA